ncbi:MAG: hypothetical protein IKW98_10380 [Prevotella sp.]|nr:hypothetical protein [Prevotella sp.]
MKTTDIAIYTITSPLHDEKAINAETQAFLSTLGIEYDLKGNDFAEYGSHTLDLIYIRTGGTEGRFLQRLPQLKEQSGGRPFLLLTSGKSNSLAASMEILSYLRQQGIGGEIIHGSAEYIGQRIQLLHRVELALQTLKGCRLGIVGKPSDWLISSSYDSNIIAQRLGIEMVEIEMKELQDIIDKTPEESTTTQHPSANTQISNALPGANRIHQALKTLVERHRLQGFTIRCFDLLSSHHNTGCLALARLNADGIVAGCEGDVPALLSMTIAQALLGVSGFQANPARIDVETGEMLVAHCTIPLNMVERYELLTHFESGIGVGIRGYMKEGDVTLFKVSGDLSRHFAEEGKLARNEASPGLCRTQLALELADKQRAEYFLKEPIGNHHIVVAGHHKQLFERLLERI